MTTAAEYEQQFVSDLKSLLIECSTDALEVAELLKIHEMERCSIAAGIAQRRSYEPHTAALGYSYIQLMKAINATSTLGFMLSSEKRRQGKLYMRAKEAVTYALNRDLGQKAGPIVEALAADLRQPHAQSRTT